MTRDDIVAEARAWLDTPFHAGQSAKGVGCDCAGLVIGVRVGVGNLRQDYWNEPGAAEFGGYKQVATSASMRRACERFLLPLKLGTQQPGDVVLIDYGRVPQHLAILVPYKHGGLSMIHALGPAAPGKVIESRLMGRMRVHAVYALPGVE